MKADDTGDLASRRAVAAAVDPEVLFCLRGAGYRVGHVTRHDGAISIERDERVAWLLSGDLVFERADAGTPFLFTILMALRSAARSRSTPG